MDLHDPLLDLQLVDRLSLGHSGLARREGALELARGALAGLGDSLDRRELGRALDRRHADLAAARATHAAGSDRLAPALAGRRWIWIEGNHDPGPIDLGGTHLAQIKIGSLTFRHIATPEKAEVSGHYHPKHRVTGRSRPAFIYNKERLILPAYGSYTGGLASHASAIRNIVGDKAIAVLTGKRAIAVPLTGPRQPAHLRDTSS